MQTCVVCYGLLRPWQFGSEHAGLSFTSNYKGKIHGHHRSQIPEYHGQQEAYSSYTDGNRTLETSNLEAIQKNPPNYYIKRIRYTAMLASKKRRLIHTAHLESSSQIMIVRALQIYRTTGKPACCDKLLGSSLRHRREVTGVPAKVKRGQLR